MNGGGVFALSNMPAFGFKLRRRFPNERLRVLAIALILTPLAYYFYYYCGHSKSVNPKEATGNSTLGVFSMPFNDVKTDHFMLKIFPVSEDIGFVESTKLEN
jgi:hypothetical protein